MLQLANNNTRIPMGEKKQRSASPHRHLHINTVIALGPNVSLNPACPRGDCKGHMTLLCGAKMAEPDISAISAPQVKRQRIAHCTKRHGTMPKSSKHVNQFHISSSTQNYTSAFRRLRCALNDPYLADLITHPKNPCTISNYLLDPRSSQKGIQTPIILILRFGAEID